MALLVLCPLKKELECLREALPYSFEEIKFGTRSILYNSEHQLYLGLGGHGKTQFGIQSQFFLQCLPHVKILICMGAGGSLQSHLACGDLVVGISIVEHDYTEKFNPKARLPDFPCTPFLIEHAKNYSSSDFKIHFGKIAGGDEDIVHGERAKSLQEKTGATVVAWESAGGIRAAKFNEVSYMEVRAITDDAKEDAAQSFMKNLPKSCSNLAKFLEYLVPLIRAN